MEDTKKYFGLLIGQHIYCCSWHQMCCCFYCYAEFEKMPSVLRAATSVHCWCQNLFGKCVSISNLRNLLFFCKAEKSPPSSAKTFCEWDLLLIFSALFSNAIRQNANKNRDIDTPPLTRLNLVKAQSLFFSFFFYQSHCKYKKVKETLDNKYPDSAWREWPGQIPIRVKK